MGRGPVHATSRRAHPRAVVLLPPVSPAPKPSQGVEKNRGTCGWRPARQSEKARGKALHRIALGGVGWQPGIPFLASFPDETTPASFFQLHPSATALHALPPATPLHSTPLHHTPAPPPPLTAGTAAVSMRLPLAVLVLCAATLLPPPAAIAADCPLDFSWPNYNLIASVCSDENGHSKCCRYINAALAVSSAMYANTTGTLGVPDQFSDACIGNFSDTLVAKGILPTAASFCGLGIKIQVSYQCAGMTTIVEMLQSPNFSDVTRSCATTISDDVTCKRCLNSGLSYLRHLVGEEDNITLNTCRDAAFIAFVGQGNISTVDTASCFFTVQGLSALQALSSRFQVYEYMENGSLQDHLHCNVKFFLLMLLHLLNFVLKSILLFAARGKHLLPWKNRIQIAIDVANALEYLHFYCDPPLYHGDVKPSNVLLDKNYRAKLAGCGPSRCSGGAGDTSGSSTPVNAKVQAAPGYVDPEYAVTQELTPKSDVYSYGVLLLELVTGKAVIQDDGNKSLVEWSRELIGTDYRLHELVDPAVADAFDLDELQVVADVIHWCTHRDGGARPSMKQVLRILYERLDPLSGRFARAVEGEEGYYYSHHGGAGRASKGNVGGGGEVVQFSGEAAWLPSSSSTTRSHCSRSVLLESGHSPEPEESPARGGHGAFFV
ncbi:hypothetical protein PR202_gb15655 [Eleusine coracana subsp. coracana]|uniref:Protein kinase domain-containing protein n=1 Tax=Eleusine coracana subsp. coracana TaxID=191504 RepID=A0AAV5EXP2_ELECO|nr:hypothetical protein PR202_gb15655 [Eleusine coracana subsp. coracana]